MLRTLKARKVCSSSFYVFCYRKRINNGWHWFEIVLTSFLTARKVFLCKMPYWHKFKKCQKIISLKNQLKSSKILQLKLDQCLLC